jgi:predicted phage baseplate assembly protein
MTDEGDECEWDLAQTDKTSTNVLYLDAPYDHIVPESWIVIEYVPPVGLKNDDVQIHSLQILKVKSVDALSRADYGTSTKVTRLTLYDSWFTSDSKPGSKPTLGQFRGVTVYAQSEDLTLTDQPISDDISGSDIELDGLYDGLQSGRWVVVSGERTDIQNTSGVNASELAMLASVTQDVRQANPTLHITTPSDEQSGGKATSLAPQTLPVALPGDKIHTTMHLATPLAHSYKRDTVAIAGNVVHATQGETKVQVLGSGDGSKSTQQFALSQSPLTYLSAPTPAGAESTLQVRVNDILWHETNSLEALGSTDRGYITTADDQDKARVTFGNGVHGARLPSGVENVKAVYRTGIGKPGNVDSGMISLLLTKPLGVRSVVNPLPATGGADRENRDQARKNAPLGVMSLDRIVSVQDYADFARTYAGIGKANAVSLPFGRQQVVYLTIAGLDNIPIDTTSDLYRNLLQSLRLFGNPSTPLHVALCEVKLLVITAKVRVLPDYLFDKVAPNIRTALYNAFSFERRELGQTAFQSEVLNVMQGVAGVEYIELEILDAVEQAKLLAALDTIHQEELQAANTGQKADEAADLTTLLGLRKHSFVRAHLARPNTVQQGGISPAQIAFLSSDVPDTLILTELTTTRFTPSSRVRHSLNHGAKK